MKFKKLISNHDGKKYLIEEDLPEVGAYLYVYEGDNCIFDYLQDNIEVCIRLAYEEFTVPMDSWRLSEE
jgi:hypothetical protein